MMNKRFSLSALALGLALVATGCENLGTGPGGETRVLLARGSVSASQAVLADAVLSQASLGAAGPVALSNVASIDLNITGVQALPVGEQADSVGEGEVEEGGWISLSLTTPAAVNLLALPAADQGGISLAHGDLPEGTYGNVRLIVSGATITFLDEVRVGPHSYEAGVPHDLFIPGRRVEGQSTILVPSAQFTVAADQGETVTLVFDASASVRKVVARGPNGILMPPVLGAERDED